MSRPTLFLVPLLLAATAAASLVAWQEHRQLDADSLVAQKAALLSSENDGLRDALAAAERKAADAQNDVRRAQIERDVTEIRQLPFKQPVVYESLDRAGIRQVVAGKLSEQYTDQQIQDMSTGYSALGLLPPHYQLKQAYINLLGEQIAAFYDQHQHKLFMFQDASLENAQNRIILAHELTHALQDQNFGLLNLALEIKDNDDRAAAASALIEGDATLVMSQYMAKDLTWKTLTDTVTYSATQSMEQIRKAPHYIREMLVFPYIQGQKFCAAVFAGGGYPALSAVYSNPPTSTAQILHPEKYFPGSRQDPIPVAIPDTTFKGVKPLADNVLGEMGARILFSQSSDEVTAEQAAAGWRGDRYLVFDHGDTLVWKTIWDSPAAAALAQSAMEAMCAQRFHLAFVRSGNDLVAGGDPAHFVRIELPAANEVVLTLATTKESSDLLNEKFAGASHG
jgi:hypothetical protein